MTARLLRWADSWPAFVLASLWLLVVLAAQVMPGDAGPGASPGGAGAAQAAQGALVHRID